MSFQFECPNGHLLEGTPDQAGQPCNCPTCGMLFLIPEPADDEPDPQAAWQNEANMFPPGAAPAAYSQPASYTDHATYSPPYSPPPTAPSPPAKSSLAELAEPLPETLHIACPKGHVLETPPEMLETEVRCPHCGSQFVLRRRNSVEYRKKAKEAQIRDDNRVGQLWLQGAIIAVVLIVLVLGAMIVLGGRR